MKSFSLIIRVNSFTKIDDRNFNKIFLSTIKENSKKIVEFISRNKDDANSSAYESLSHKQKSKVKFDVKI